MLATENMKRQCIHIKLVTPRLAILEEMYRDGLWIWNVDMMGLTGEHDVRF